VSASYLRGTDGSPAVRLSDGFCWSLSRDTQRVICGSPENQLNEVPTKSGEIKPLTHDQLIHWSAQWFPDEKRVLFLGQEDLSHASRAYVQDLMTGQTPAITPEGASNYYRLSPNGEQLAVAMGAEYRTSVYPVNGGKPRPVPGLQAGEVPVAWSPDNRFLYCYRLGETPANVFQVEVASGRRSPWKKLAPSDPVGITFLGSMFIS